MTEQTVDTAACVEVVRALVKAFEEKGHRLSRRLRHEYKPESDLTPWDFTIRTELIEQGMKALGLPVPEVPKPKKVPSLPSEAQGKVLAAMAVEGARLKTWRSTWRYQDHYEVVQSDGGQQADIAQATFEKLTDYSWITFDRGGEHRNDEKFYKLTDAGREALGRYQAKQSKTVAA